MPGETPKLTSENAIPPDQYVFSNPEDVESDCKCDAKDAGSDRFPSSFKCNGGTACAEAKGSCRLVLVSPGDPHLRIRVTSKTNGSDDGNIVTELPPGWRIICACLKYTGKDPTDEEKAKWPAFPKWVPPAGYTISAKQEPCGMPVKDAERNWHCSGDKCHLVGLAKDSNQLVLLSPRAKDREVKRYDRVFCIDLDPVPAAGPH